MLKGCLNVYSEYMNFVVGRPPTTTLFLNNLDEKIADREFEQGYKKVLLRLGIGYDQNRAYELI